MEQTTIFPTKNTGLSADTVRRISEVFARNADIERVVLYGSRAMGNYTVGSDIDFVVDAPNMPFRALLQLQVELDDLLLPYTLDVSLLHHIENPDLLDHIKRVGRLFFEKKRV